MATLLPAPWRCQRAAIPLGTTHAKLARPVEKWGLELAAGAATRSFAQAPAAKYAPMFPVEKDAQLRLLRWSGFIKADEESWNANSKKFQEATGVPVSIEYIT